MKGTLISLLIIVVVASLIGVQVVRIVEHSVEVPYPIEVPVVSGARTLEMRMPYFDTEVRV